MTIFHATPSSSHHHTIQLTGYYLTTHLKRGRERGRGGGGGVREGGREGLAEQYHKIPSLPADMYMLYTIHVHSHALQISEAVERNRTNNTATFMNEAFDLEKFIALSKTYMLFDVYVHVYRHTIPFSGLIVKRIMITSLVIPSHNDSSIKCVLMWNNRVSLFLLPLPLPLSPSQCTYCTNMYIHGTA